jgi:hypothetical protein
MVKEKENEREYMTPKFSSLIDLPQHQAAQRNQFVPQKLDIKYKIRNDLLEANRK